MLNLRAIAVLLLCLGVAAPLARAADGDVWSIESGEERSLLFDLKSGTITYTNGVTVRYGDATLTAARARLNQDTGEVQAEGKVRLQQATETWYGEKIQFNFKTRKILATDFKAGQPPFFLKGDALAGDQSADVYVLANGVVTTDDYAEPGYQIRAKALSIAPGDYIEAKDAVLYLGQTPVFWWPKWRRSLRHHPSHWVLVPGYRSKYGAYLLTSYEWYWNERLKGALHLDERSVRGPGVGPDFQYHLPSLGNGDFKYYYTHDSHPPRDLLNQPTDPDRQRVWFTHQGELASNLVVRAAVRYQTDPRVIRDFWETEYREHTQPSTYVEVDKLWSNWSLDLLAQPRVNNFQETVERLPELKLTGFRQQVFGAPLFYESESSAGYFQREFASVDTNRFAALRADTYHQVLIPWNFFGWLNLTPRVGGRYTHYGEADGPGSGTAREDRTVFNTGAELSFKASRTWAGTRSSFWEIDGLRHIVQPSINYVYVPNPSVPLRRLPQFDYELPSAELLPINYPDYNSIDSIDSQNVIRWGLLNKLQTKRKDGIEDLVHWSLYTDWRLRPHSDQDTFADLYSKLDLRPFSWLSLRSELNYNINGGVWDQLNNAVTFAPNDTWSWTVGERFLRTGAFYGTNIGHTLIYSSLYYKFSPNWATRAIHYYDARQRVLQHQTYTLYRDFRSWTFALSFRVLHNRGGQNDYAGAITFSSKAFPRFELGDDLNKPAQLLGF